MKVRRPLQLDMFPGAQPLEDEVVAKAMTFNPISILVGFSGGDDSLAAAHWMMTHVPNCRPFSIITGIGIQETIDYRRRVADRLGWDLIEVHAKEDCGQDYDEMVRKHGFPGPAMHGRMYQRLKERAIRLIVANEKAKAGKAPKSRAKVLIATGIRHDESQRRMGYGGREVDFVGSQMWVNPLYWRPQSWFMDYIRQHNLPRNPVSVTLGMSGECLCGAFADKGEKALVRIVCPSTAARLDQLEIMARACGHNWGWEEGPPRPAKPTRVPKKPDMRMCRGCSKTPYMFGEAQGVDA